MQRADLTDITSTMFDLAVIGGGINGAAVARDAAMRGMSVVLLERDDLASGTSAWSSRLIHGGLRYLEHREFGLVRESLRERERLLSNAPHLVQPLGMLVPIYSGNKRGPKLIRAGMVLYDVLSYDKSLPLHDMLSRADVLERQPGLEPDGLKGGAHYFDAQVTFAERLVIEQAISAWEHGAQIATRCMVTGIRTEGAVVRGVTVRDADSGEEIPVNARVVVNVAGPWVDEVLTGAPNGTVSQRLIGGTKGSHIIVPKWEGAPAEAIYYESLTDGRPILIIPWNGMMLLGSTDLRYQGDLDRVVASDEEIAYLMGELNTLFPENGLGDDPVLFSYAGVRPLPHTRSGSTASITRRHVIRNHAPALRGLLSVIGGKLTTHRSLAEDVVDKVGGVLGVDAECRTVDTPLPGAAGVAFEAFRDRFAAQADGAGVSETGARRLVDLYGVRAERVLEIARRTPDLAQVFDEESGAIAAEAIHAVDGEMAGSLADILLRRTMVGYGSQVGVGADERLLEIAGKSLRWTKPRQRAELAAYRNWIERYRPRTFGDHLESSA